MSKRDQGPRFNTSFCGTIGTKTSDEGAPRRYSERERGTKTERIERERLESCPMNDDSSLSPSPSAGPADGEKTPPPSRRPPLFIFEETTEERLLTLASWNICPSYAGVVPSGSSTGTQPLVAHVKGLELERIPRPPHRPNSSTSPSRKLRVNQVFIKCSFTRTDDIFQSRTAILSSHGRLPDVRQFVNKSPPASDQCRHEAGFVFFLHNHHVQNVEPEGEEGCETPNG